MSEEKEIIPLNELSDYTVMRTAMRMITVLYRFFHQHGYQITPQQWSVLHSLWEEEGLCPSELSAKTGRDRHNITRILNLLEKNGLIHRQVSPEDKRRSNIFLTSEGKTLKDKLVPMAGEFSKHIFAGFSREEILQLQKLHERMLVNIESFDLQSIP